METNEQGSSSIELTQTGSWLESLGLVPAETLRLTMVEDDNFAARNYQWTLKSQVGGWSISQLPIRILNVQNQALSIILVY